VPQRDCTGHTRAVRPRPNGQAHLQHAADGRRALRLLDTVALDEGFALKRHAALDGDATAEGFDALDVAVGDRLAVIEEPV
jgi:hypothetical protein